MKRFSPPSGRLSIDRVIQKVYDDLNQISRAVSTEKPSNKASNVSDFRFIHDRRNGSYKMQVKFADGWKDFSSDETSKNPASAPEVVESNNDFQSIDYSDLDNRYLQRILNGADLNSAVEFRINTGLRIGVDIQAYSNALTVYSNNSLTATELQYLSGIDQSVSKTSSVEFANATFTGNVFVQGDKIQVDNRIETADSIIDVNYGEPNAGVTLGYAGLRIDRGSDSSYFFGFDEVRDRFTIGKISNLTALQIATTQVVATREDTPVENGIAYWDLPNKRFSTSQDLLFDGTSLVAESIKTSSLRTTLFKPTTISGMGGEILFSAVSEVKSIDTVLKNIIVEDAVFSNGDFIVVSGAMYNQFGFSNIKLEVSSTGSAATGGGTQYSYTIVAGDDSLITLGDSVTRISGDLVYINATEGANSPRLAGYNNVTDFSDSPVDGNTATPVWELHPTGGKIAGFTFNNLEFTSTGLLIRGGSSPKIRLSGASASIDLPEASNGTRGWIDKNGINLPSVSDQALNFVAPIATGVDNARVRTDGNKMYMEGHGFSGDGEIDIIPNPGLGTGNTFVGGMMCFDDTSVSISGSTTGITISKSYVTLTGSSGATIRDIFTTQPLRAGMFVILRNATGGNIYFNGSTSGNIRGQANDSGILLRPYSFAMFICTGSVWTMYHNESA